MAITLNSAHLRLRHSRPLVIATLAVVLLVAITIGLATGASRISAASVVAVFANALGLSASVDPQTTAIVLDVRLPRVWLAALVGGGLALCGAVLQGLFRNPLADPTLIGVSGGASAAVAALLMLTSHAALPELVHAAAIPLAAFAGGLGASLLAYRLATSGARTALVTLLLAGIAINAFAAALVGLASALATGEQLRAFAAWNWGSLNLASGERVAALTVPVVLLCVWLTRLAMPLNVMALGEREAGHAGVDVQRLKRRVIVGTAAIVGVIVAAGGNLFFVGLVAPHIVRLTCGPDHRLVLPASALLGAALVVLADAIARSVMAPAELPLGVVTALAGAPFFVGLLVARQREAEG